MPPRMCRHGVGCAGLGCRRGQVLRRTRRWVQSPGVWSLERQEQLMTVAGLAPLAPLTDNCPADYPVNVEPLGR